MVITEYFMTRSDGVRLFKTIDAKIDENGNPRRDEDGNLIPSGKMIIQIPTHIEYDVAIDVEGASYTYIKSDKDIEKDEVEQYEN